MSFFSFFKKEKSLKTIKTIKSIYFLPSKACVNLRLIFFTVIEKLFSVITQFSMPLFRFAAFVFNYHNFPIKVVNSVKSL